MKVFYPLTLITLMSVISGCSTDTHKDPITVMSFNIRYDNPGDGVNAWKNRKDLAGRTILSEKAIIIGMQEVLKNQMADLDSLLPGYGHVGVGRGDGKEEGEYNPIFYDINRFEILDQATFWLSPAPHDTGSIGWDAVLPRIVTWAKFLDQQTDQNFYFINTHFDHMGDTARVESAKLIMDFILKNTEGLPVILTGDFNSEPSDAPYHFITGNNSAGFKLRDASQNLDVQQNEPEGTFNGFGGTEPTIRIDFIFLNNKGQIMNFKTVKARDGDIYISDHYPVAARISY